MDAAVWNKRLNLLYAFLYWIAEFWLNCNLIGSRWAELIEIQRIWIANYLELICDRVSNGIPFFFSSLLEWVGSLQLKFVARGGSFSTALWEDEWWMRYSRKVHLHFRGWKECRMRFHVNTSLYSSVLNLCMFLFKFSTVLGWKLSQC